MAEASDLINASIEIGKILFYGGLSSLITVIFSRRRLRAEALKLESEGRSEEYNQISETYDRQIDMLQRRNIDLEQRYENKRKRIVELEREVVECTGDRREWLWKRQQLEQENAQLRAQLTIAHQLAAQYRGDARRYHQDIEWLRRDLGRTDDLPSQQAPEPKMLAAKTIPPQMSSVSRTDPIDAASAQTPPPLLEEPEDTNP